MPDKYCVFTYSRSILEKKMPKMREKINNRKLKAIGYLDLILTLNIICLVFFMVIGKFYPPHKNVNQEETTTEELEQVEKTRWGNLGFYSSTSFLVMVGIYALSSSCMLAQASNLQVYILIMFG